MLDYFYAIYEQFNMFVTESLSMCLCWHVDKLNDVKKMFVPQNMFIYRNNYTVITVYVS